MAPSLDMKPKFMWLYFEPSRGEFAVHGRAKAPLLESSKGDGKGSSKQGCHTGARNPSDQITTKSSLALAALTSKACTVCLFLCVYKMTKQLKLFFCMEILFLISGKEPPRYPNHSGFGISESC